MVFPVMSASRLPSGTHACAIILGEFPARCVLLQRDERVKAFKMGLVKREMIIEYYRLFGNKLERPKFSDADNNIVGRNTFYHDFLLKNKELLEDFLSESSSNPFAPPIPTNELLEPINPTAMLKEANSLAHDITYDDVWFALLLMKEADLADGKQWEKLAVLVVGDEMISNWKDNVVQVKFKCQAKRDCVVQHALRQQAEQFEAVRTLEQHRRFFLRSEAQGFVVSWQTFDEAIAKLRSQQFITFGLLGIIFILLISK